MPGAELPTVLKLDREQLVALVAALLVEVESGCRPTPRQIMDATKDALEVVKEAKKVVNQ